MINYVSKLFKIYLDTTNPKTEFKRLVNVDILIAILVHLILYVAAIIVFNNVTQFDIKVDENTVLIMFGLMCLGYFARLLRSKSIYKTFLDQKNKEKVALQKTRKLMDEAYFLWFFLA